MRVKSSEQKKVRSIEHESMGETLTQSLSLNSLYSFDHTLLSPLAAPT